MSVTVFALLVLSAIFLALIVNIVVCTRIAERHRWGAVDRVDSFEKKMAKAVSLWSSDLAKVKLQQEQILGFLNALKSDGHLSLEAICPKCSKHPVAAGDYVCISCRQDLPSVDVKPN